MNSKTRYWWFIVYEESAIENWKQFLQDLCIPVCISPCHDKDVDKDGQFKKPHYHVIVCFEGPTTYKNVLESICQPINATIPKRILSLRGAYRYLTHEDHENKYHYDSNDIIEYGDFKLELTDNEISYLTIAILNIIDEKNITTYKELCDYYISIGDYDNFYIIKKCHTFFKYYLSDCRKVAKKT